MKNTSRLLLLNFVWVVLFAVNQPAKASDPVTERKSVESYEKDIAKDQHQIANKKSDLLTQNAILKRDIAQYGQDSNQVRADQDRIKSLHKQLAQQKAEMGKDQEKKRAEAGQVPAEDLNQSTE